MQDRTTDLQFTRL